MNKKEAKEAFYNIRCEYKKIVYPKYLHADLDDLQKKYNLLKEMEVFLQGRFHLRQINQFHFPDNYKTQQKGDKINHF